MNEDISLSAPDRSEKGGGVFFKTPPPVETLSPDKQRSNERKY